MEFIDREKELKLLGEIRRRSEKSARMTVITGRRRIGKTTLPTGLMKTDLFSISLW